MELNENNYICKMQTVNINNIAYNIPISWDEVTYKQGCDIIKNVNDKGLQLASITGIPMNIINALADEQVSKLFALISFTENLEVFDNDNVKDEYSTFDFGSIPYGEAEKCRQIMTKELTGYEAIIGIMDLLIKKNITDEPFLEWIGTANFFLNKSIISMIVMPSSMKLTEALNKSKLVLSDYKNLVALERMLNLQGVGQSVAQ